jgi:hypothetical protein
MLVRDDPTVVLLPLPSSPDGLRAISSNVGPPPCLVPVVGQLLTTQNRCELSWLPEAVASSLTAV